MTLCLDTSFLPSGLFFPGVCVFVCVCIMQDRNESDMQLIGKISDFCLIWLE